MITEKKTINEVIPFEIDWSYSVDINKIKIDIDNIQKLGATFICFDFTDQLEITAFKKRLETDGELNKRLSNYKMTKDWQKKLDLENFNRIKEKYNL